MPASTSTDGCAALPNTVRRFTRSCRLRSLAPSMSTTVMSFASDARLSATDEPTWPAPRITIFTSEVRAKKHAFYAEFPRPPKWASVFLAPGEYTERLQLPIQVSALQAAALCQARDRSVRLREMMLEVGPLEGLARLAKREVERDFRFDRASRELRQHPFRVADSDFFLEAREGERAYGGGEVLEVARPGEVAQNVEGACRKNP